MWCLRKLNLLLLVTVALLTAPLLTAQNVAESDPQFPAVRAVGEQLKCQCEAHCSYTITGCNMMGCSFRAKMLPEIREGVDAGLSTQENLESLIAKYGSELRNAPRAEGFGLFGWAMPFAALAAGLIATPFVVRHWRAQQAAAPANVPIDEKLLSRYQDEIEQDLDDL